MKRFLKKKCDKMKRFMKNKAELNKILRKTLMPCKF